LVQGLPEFHDPNLLIGAEGFSDAGVYLVHEGLAIVQSVDFFPPLVDDPFTFGRIAAANSMSDIYACGARPTTALNVVGFPDDQLDLSVLQEILRGGGERVQAAGAVVVGGHSVRDAEIKYGLSVTGVVDPALMMTNRSARAGDVLILTKPLGTGFITTALRAGDCPDDVREAACASMVFLNATAAEAAVAVGARAATDVTGFAIGGHALEMAEASDVTIVLQLDALPLLPGAESLVDKGYFTRANPTNRQHVSASAHYRIDPGSQRAEFLFDPQTSGGLLVAVPEGRVDGYMERCRDGGIEAAAVVGRVTQAGDTRLIIE
jgi:selenide,water dikinase